MTNRIPLPKVATQKNAHAHSFPYQIALQTQEFIQGAIFYHTCADEMSGIVIRLPNGLDILKANLLKAGMPMEQWESGWSYFNKYPILFREREMVFQNVLITIRSYWDWYVTKLAEFIIFAQENTNDVMIENKRKNLKKITGPEILEQICQIEQICNLDFMISIETKQHIKEMSLVRNLGIHSRWEVDQKYLDKTLNLKHWQIGDFRIFDSNELGLWHSSLITVIHKTCKTIAQNYVSAPPYRAEERT